MDVHGKASSMCGVSTCGVYCMCVGAWVRASDLCARVWVVTVHANVSMSVSVCVLCES